MGLNTTLQELAGCDSNEEDVVVSHLLMVFDQVIGEVVGKIVEFELSLVDLVMDPVEVRVHCFGSALFDSVIGKDPNLGERLNAIHMQ